MYLSKYLSEKVVKPILCGASYYISREEGMYYVGMHVPTYLVCGQYTSDSSGGWW